MKQTYRSPSTQVTNNMALSSDTLAAEVRKLLDEVELTSYSRRRQLEEALDAYRELRRCETIKDETDPQSTDLELAPITQRSGVRP